MRGHVQSGAGEEPAGRVQCADPPTAGMTREWRTGETGGQGIRDGGWGGNGERNELLLNPEGAGDGGEDTFVAPVSFLWRRPQAILLRAPASPGTEKGKEQSWF